MSLFSRAPAIAAGYLAAVGVASAIVVGPFWIANPAGAGRWMFLGIAFVVTAAITLVPALVAVIHAERRGRRDLAFHLVCGLAAGGLGFVAMLVFFVAIGGKFVGDGGFFWGAALVMAAAGSAAGATYWAIAGRRAGAWHTPPEA